MLIGSPGICRAGVWSWEYLKYTMAVRTGYDDNVVMSTRDPEEDSMNTVSSVLRYNYPGERFSSTLKLRLMQWLYSNKTNLNTLDKEYNLGLDYRLLPRLTLSLSGFYAEDTTLEEELEEAGYVAKREDRSRSFGSAKITYQLNELTNLDLAYSDYRYWYDYPRYSDTAVHQATAYLTRQFKNMRTAGLLQFLYRHYKYEEARSDDYQLLVGFRHLFSPSLDMEALAGFSYSRARYPIIRTVPVFIGPFIFFTTERRSEVKTDKGWRANLSLNKKWENTTAQLTFIRDLSTSSYGYTIERTRIRLELDHQVNEALSVQLFGSYYLSESQLVRVRRREWRSWRVRPSLRYQLTKGVMVELLYEYTNSRNKIADTRAERNRIYVQLYLNWPR